MSLYGLDNDDVVISGLSMWFPGLKNFEELSKTLTEGLAIHLDGTEKVTVGYFGEVPETTRLIKPPFHLDNIAFGLSSQVAYSTDHLTRKLLERSMEALLDAGLLPRDVEDVMCEVYQNTLIADGELILISPSYKDTYGVTGMCRSMMANRISFFINAKGCSASLDSSYIGGMQGLQSGVDAIRSGRADIAVVCGGMLCPEPTITQQFNDLGWLCMDGKTRPFDDQATGFFRSEGIAAVILQRAKDAKRIYAKVRHVSVSPARRTPPIHVQTKHEWEKILKEFYKKSKIDVNDICYLEAYGSGVKEMDAAELNGVATVLCEGRTADSPLLVGSVKSQLGHLEAGADFASLFKALVCFETGSIPRTSEFTTPNASVPSLLDGKIQVVQKNTPLSENGLIAINGWAVGGVFGHLVLERFRKPKTLSPLTIPRLVPIAARTEDFLPRIISWLEAKPFDNDYLHLVTDVFKRKIDQFLGRGYILLPNKETLVSHHQGLDESHRPLWYVFSGMGSQWVGMGRALLSLPVTSASLHRSHSTLKQVAPHVDLIHIVTTDDASVFDNILHSFVGIAAIQIALVDMLKALKLEPDGIVGHSVGELGCAYADGSLTAQQMILAAYYRGRASLEANLERGFMAAVGMGYAQIKEELPAGVEVACRNSATSCTLSGPADIVSCYVEKLQARGVFARTVNVSNIAYHSTYIQPAAPLLLNYLKKLIPDPLPRSSKWVSSSVPEADWALPSAQLCSAEYHTNNLLSTVLFEEASRHVPRNAVVVEIAPHGLLQAILKRSLGGAAINIALTSRSAKDPLVHLLEAVGKIYTAGYEVDINALYPTETPVYPVPAGTGQMQPFFEWVPNGVPRMFCFAPQKLSLNIRQALRECDDSMRGYQVAWRSLFPLSVYFHIIGKHFAQYERNLTHDLPLTFTDFRMNAVTALSPEHDEWVEASILRGNHLFEVTTKAGDFIASGTVSYPKEDKTEQEVTHSQQQDGFTIEKDDIYRWFDKFGCVFPPTLQPLTMLKFTSSGLESRISGSCSTFQKTEALLQLVMLDACSRLPHIVFPYYIRQVDISPTPPTDQDLLVVFDRVSGVVRCPGVAIAGLKFRQIQADVPLSFHSVTTVPFDNPPLQSSEEFVKLWKDLIEESRQPSRSPLKVVSLLNQHQGIQGSEDAEVVICEGGQLHNLPSHLARVSSFTTGRGQQLYLLKKVSGVEEVGEVMLIPESRADLVRKLRSLSSSSALLVAFHEPQEGIAQFQDLIRRQVDTSHTSITWLFILDQKAPEFSLTNPFYKQQLEKGISTNILMDGAWHVVYKRNLADVAAQSAEPTLPQGKQETHTETRGVDQVEQVGRMMGVPVKSATAAVAAGSGAAGEFDPVLTWPVPAGWTEQEAAAVPIPYSLVYHCLGTYETIRSYERVLVTDALSVGGQAACAVALSRGHHVFATVATKEEADQLRRLYPQINTDDIFLHSDRNFVLMLKQAAGDTYPENVFNLFDGDLFKSCFLNCAPYTKFFHFGRDDITSNTSIGMYPFINAVSFIPVTPGQVSSWSLEEKQKVRELVAGGLAGGVVRPALIVGGAPAPQRAERDAARGLYSLQQYKAHAHQIIIDSKRTYAVVGDVSNGSDVEVVEWLARRGAARVLLCNPSLTASPRYQHKLRALTIRTSVNVELCDYSALENIIRSTPIEALFYIHLENHTTRPELELSGQVRHLVSLSRSHRRAVVRSLPSCHVVWQAEAQLPLLAAALDVIAPFFGGHCVISVSHQEDAALSRLAENTLRESIPESREALERLGGGLATAAVGSLVELPTAGLPNRVIQDVSPVLLLPGLHDDAVTVGEALVRHLMYPAYVVPHIASHSHLSVPQMARALLPAVLKVQDNKMFNIMAVGAGCALAVELTQQLELTGCYVSLLLFDDVTMLPPKPQMCEIIRHALHPLAATAHTDLAISYIEDRLSAVADYHMDEVTIKGPLTVVRSQSAAAAAAAAHTFNYNKLCVNNTVVELALPHREVLQSDDLVQLVNKCAISQVMGTKHIHSVLWPELEEYLQARAMIEEEKTFQ